MKINSSEIRYQVSFPEAAGHYAKVTIITNAKAKEIITAKMPAWTPGSYKIREFSQHVERFEAIQNDVKLAINRVDKNTWSIVSESDAEIQISYFVYAFELGVRTSYVDLNKAFLHGASVFVYLEGRELNSLEVHVDALENWEAMYVAVPRSKNQEWSFNCDNYDQLIDSPIAIGNFEHVEYESGGTPHQVVMIGKGNYNLSRIQRDFKTISDEEVRMFGGKHPSDFYIHFIQNVDNGGGGLEHANCQTSQVNRWAYTDHKKYLSFLGLVAHEYFHLWNVKRIRPMELGPFDYNRENYTEMLWVAEGITSYYDDLVLLRAGFHTEESYLEVLSTAINRYENTHGNTLMTLAESSKLAWVKGYLPNENSDNCSISYYNKGLLVAWLLDLEILKATNGSKRLDDVMRVLNDYSNSNSKGITYDYFLSVCNEIAEKDLTDFLYTYVYTTEPIPYQAYVEEMGIDLFDQTDRSKADVGMKVKAEGGKSLISYIHPNGAAIRAGLSVNDEVIAIDGWRITGDLTAEISRLNINKEVEILYTREGEIVRTKINPTADTRFNYKLILDPDLDTLHGIRKDLWLKNS